MAAQIGNGLRAAGLTDVGRVRKANEDNFAIDAEVGLAMVADGMGGPEAGEIASETAVSTVADFLFAYDRDAADATLRSEDVAAAGRDAWQVRAVEMAIAEANGRIYAKNVERGFAEGQGMGTTVAGLLALESGGRLCVFHVGDSRVYRFRDGTLDRLTRDHSLYEAWLGYGGQGQAPARNVITRAVGPWPSIEVDISIQDCLSGDIFLICSDGLSGMLEDDAMAGILAETGEDLDEACRRLVERANANGGTDNVTVVLAAPASARP